MAQTVAINKQAAALVDSYTAAINELTQKRDVALQMLIQALGLPPGPWKYEDGKLVNDQPTKGDQMAVRAIQARESGDIERSHRLTKEAISVGVSDALAYSNDASCFGFKGLLAAAICACIDAIERYPQQEAMLRYERAFHRLRAGVWKDGWDDWEFRTSRLSLVGKLAELLPGVPEWDGATLDGGALLVMAEGGIGDTIMYARYMPLAVAAANAHVVVLCKSKAVAEVFADIEGVKAITGDEALPGDAAAWIGMWSLPKLLCTEPPAPLRCFGGPESGAYRGRPRIGICWHGDADAAAAIYRPSKLKDWDPLLHVEHVDWVNLQLGEDCGNLRKWLDFGDTLQLGDTLQQTADVIRDLDLVITCDGMIAHLAGTIGVPTWMVLHRYGYWPWEPNGDRTVWYPSIRIFREEHGWPHLFNRLAGMVSSGQLVEQGYELERGPNSTASGGVASAAD